MSLWPHASQIVRAAMLCGLILYYGVIPLEFLITREYRVDNERFQIELGVRSLIDGLTVVSFAFLGFWLGTRSLARMSPNQMVRAADLGACAARVALVLLAMFSALAVSAGICLKATDVEMAATMDSDPIIGFSSLALTAASAVSAIAAVGYAYNATTRRKSALWVLAVLALGGLGLRLGDKDPLAAAVFMCIANFALCLRGRALSIIVMCTLCVLGLFAVPAVSMVKFMFFGIEPDLSLLLVRPSTSDPGGAFSLMATAMDHAMPLGVAHYEPLAAIWQDVCSTVPKFIWATRPQPPGNELMSFLMGQTFVEGYGVGYSPYVDLYSAFGHAGIAVGGLIMGRAVTLLLRFTARVDSAGHLVLVCAMLSFFVLVSSQRLSLMGSLKQLLYYNAVAIFAFVCVSAFRRTRSN